MKEWLFENWDKILTSVLTVLGAGYAAWRRFSSRMNALEADVAALKTQQAETRAKQLAFEKDVVSSLEKIEEKLGGIMELKVFVERNDVQLSQLRDDIREVRNDVKSLMLKG